MMRFCAPIVMVLIFYHAIGCSKKSMPTSTSQVKKNVQGQTARTQQKEGADRLAAQARAKSSYVRAVQAYQQGNLEGAETDFQSALTQDPGLALPSFGIGMIRLKQNRPKEAITAFSNTLLLRPGYAPAYLGMGLANRQLGDYAAAEKAYLSGIKYDGGLANLYYNLGILYEVYLGRPKDALVQYQTYLSLAQNDPDQRVKTWVSMLQQK